jgi:hypothetical protein
MHKKYFFALHIIFSFLIISIFSGCEKTFVPAPVPAQLSFTEDFDTVANLYKKGWVFVNNSKPQGNVTWDQGIAGVFAAYSYHASGDEYILADFLFGDNLSTLSGWMITPPIEMKNGDIFSFYTRTVPNNPYPDRLQVRVNLSDSSAEVGNTATSVGKFTTLLKDINSNLATGGFPQEWTKYEFTLSGLAAPLKRRIAFRYYVDNGGPSGFNSYAVGIDRFQFESVQ